MKRLTIIASLLFLSGYWNLTSAQNNPYFMNGSAIQENCNCYTITPDVLAQSGSVWNVNKIDLRNSFNFVFDVFLGCTDSDGADGIVFVLQPISVSVGTSGEGLGFQNVSPSIGVAIDTWQNTNNNDPYEDHIAIHRDGDLDHNSANNLAGPVSAIENNPNIEDCKLHSFRISWDATTKVLKAQIDGVDRVQTTIDLVPDVFRNDPMVFWGFTGSTGGSKNLQRFCTALNAKFTLPPDLNTCFPVTLAFADSSSSFGAISRYDWDFGDGTKSDLATPLPHTYAQPGDYDVKLNILGANGCYSDTFQQRIVIGSDPMAAYTLEPAIVCDSIPVFFRDQSTVEFGTINRWDWAIDGTAYSAQSPGPIQFDNTGPGTSSLRVYTQEGCESELTSKDFQVYKTPSVMFAADDICIGDPSFLNGVNLNPSVSIARWSWQFGDGGGSSASANVSHRYQTAGIFPVMLTATSDDGCISYEMKDSIRVFQTKADAGKDTILATGQPYVLMGKGGEFYQWSPSTGISDPSIASPTITLQADATLTLTATTSFGCPTTDVVYIKVYKGPGIYVPNAFTPNDDGKNDRFRPVAVGMSEILYFRIFNRFGQLVYESKDTFTGWDGKTNGYKQPNTTYVWQVAGIDFSGKTHVKKGTVTLVR
ncbi:MAG: PKD domain-containing protein [Flavitalea sp.]